MHKFVLVFAGAVFWFSLYIYMPYLTPALLAMGVSATIAGVIVAVHALVQLVVRLPVGFIMGRLGRHKFTVVSGMVLSALAAFLIYLSPTPWMLGIANAVSGFSSAMYVGFLVIYNHYYAADQGDRAMGLLGAAVQIGILAAFLVGGALYESGGIRVLALTAACAAFAGLILSAFIEDAPTKPSAGAAKDMRTLIKSRRLAASIVLGILLRLVVFATAFAFTPKLAQDIGAKGMELGIINAIFVGSAALGSYLITIRAGRAAGDVVLSMIGFGLLAVYAFSVVRARMIPVFMFCQFVGGLGYSSLSSIFTANAVRNLADEYRSSAMAIYKALISVGSTIGPIIVGGFADRSSYLRSYTVIGFVAVAGIALAAWTGKRHLLPGPRSSTV